MGNYRLLLCRPVSGLYSILCQIGLAIAYAHKYQRVVIVDTNPPHTDHFRDSFSNYFISLRDDLILDIHNHADLLNQLSVEPNALEPKALAGRINSYHVVWDQARLCRVDAASGTQLSFDFTRDYDEPLLIHHAGALTHHPKYPLLALAMVRLQDRVRDEIKRRLSRIAGPFKAMHIRATDYQTNYCSFIDSLREQAVGKLFVATDNRAALAYVREQCRDAEIYSFSHLPDEAGQPLHLRPNPDTVWETNMDAIADLVVLAHAQELWLATLKPNIFRLNLSGYSRLSRELMLRPKLLEQLMWRG